MKRLILVLVLLAGILGFASAGFCDDEALVVDENGNVGIGVTDPQAKLHVNGDTEINGSIGTKNGTLVVRKNIFSDIITGNSNLIYVHIRTPETQGCSEMFRYDLEGYGIYSGLHSYTWAGYMTNGGLNYSTANDKVGSRPLSQYIGSDGHLYLKFGPLNMYYSSFFLDYQSGAYGEKVEHKREGYSVIIREDSGNQ